MMSDLLSNMQEPAKVQEITLSGHLVNVNLS